MELLRFLVVAVLVVASFRVAFALAKSHERKMPEDPDEGITMKNPGANGPYLNPILSSTVIGAGIPMLALVLALLAPTYITPAWLQYAMLIVLPAILGYITRVVLTARTKTR